MKKIVVMSDSHGFHQMIDEVKKREKDADFYVHCGDSEAEDERMKGWLCVRGNNDWYSHFPEHIIFQAEKLRFYVCHGHRFGYFNRGNAMLQTLKENNCDILLSGHTHVPQCDEVNHFYFINPGSTTLPRGGSERSYCVIMVDVDQIDVTFKTLN